MIRPRLSIAAGVGLVLLAGFGLAALRSATVLWVQAVATGSLGLLTFAILRGCAGRNRPFWRGFAVFGWLYALICFGPWTEDHIRPMLLTSYLLDFTWLISPRQGPVSVGLMGPGPLAGPAYSFSHDEWYIRYHLIGHWLAALIAGAIGGGLATLRGGRGRPDDDHGGEPS